MLFKKLIRTIGVYKAQFISMIIMIALGTAIFVGFNMEWYAIEYNTDKYFEQTGYADFRIINETGRFTEEEAEKIKTIDGVKEVSRFVSVNATVNNSDPNAAKKTLAITVTENTKVSFFTLISGEKYDPESEDGIWLSDKYADVNGVKIGDKISFSYAKFKMEGVVKGLVKSSEYLVCVEDDSELMPKYEKHGFAYISPAMFSAAVKDGTHGIFTEFYPEINVIGEGELKTFKKAP